MRTLAAFAFSFSAAVFAGTYLELDPWLFPLSGVLALLACALTFLLRRRERARLRAGLILFGLAAGLLWTGVYSWLFFRPAQELDDQTCRMTATVADWPQETDYGGYSVLVQVDTAHLARPSAVLYVDGQGAGLRPGDRIESVVHWTLGDRTFSGEAITYYTAKGIFLQGEAYGRLDVEPREGFPWRYWPAVLSRMLKEGIRAAFPAEEGGVVDGIVTGNRDNLTDQFTSSLERVGLSHTIAVSGMHLAFLADLLSRLLGKGKRSTAVLTILWAVFFSGIAGYTPSVTRSAVMIVLLQLAPLLDRERDAATSLGFALMCLLAANPFSAAHIGLQLSFAAVAGILLTGDKLQGWLSRALRLDTRPKNRLDRLWRRVPRFVVSTLASTLGASVLTTPLVAYYFHSFSLISPLANLLTLWAVGFLLLGGLLAGVLAWLCLPLAQLLAVPLSWLARYMLWAVDWLSRPTLAALSMESVLYRAWVAFLYLLLLAAVLIRGKKRPVTALCFGALTLALALTATWAVFRSGNLSVTVLDVGQGQSVLLRQGERLILVDCGGDSWDDPGDIAADYIQTQGRGSLDLLVISHYHADHANGVPQLLRRVRVGAVALPDVEEGDPLREEILSLAQELDVPVTFIREDTRLELGEGQSLTLYAPVVGESGDTNELGLTALASAGDFDVLIPGDLPGEGELALLSIADLPDVELLVTGHHGSATSTTQELLDALRPEVAAISVGLDNRYGHPAQETLDKLEAAGAEIYRTDRDGTIRVRG